MGRWSPWALWIERNKSASVWLYIVNSYKNVFFLDKSESFWIVSCSGFGRLWNFWGALEVRGEVDRYKRRTGEKSGKKRRWQKSYIHTKRNTNTEEKLVLIKLILYFGLVLLQTLRTFSLPGTECKLLMCSFLTLKCYYAILQHRFTLQHSKHEIIWLQTNVTSCRSNNTDQFPTDLKTKRKDWETKHNQKAQNLQSIVTLKVK